ncbi:Dual specificity testis-specific protein kinase 1 [Amphibalanus amphitrite]|uniref:dual-specificity kinase n=1 Tax=Amphibalanus amphitrite TaxID=1232801 RepID=A0A6A4XFC8_AMPAM|nr:Dual specificity testis-specific protein kinase 1 [Amphibalanus amphitrite]
MWSFSTKTDRKGCYINGGSLEQLVQSPEPLTWCARTRLGLDMAQALSYLHSQQVFHRDLTSKNVLVRRNDDLTLTAVVGDFGLAARIPDPRVPSRLSTVGSFWWMAPECISNLPYDQRADVFSFGVILLEMVGRVSADPDVLLRTPSFGVDYVAFASLCPPDCDLELLLLAFTCCLHAASSRPSFAELVRRLEVLLAILRPQADAARRPIPAAAPTTHWRCSREDRLAHQLLSEACSPSDKARLHRRPWRRQETLRRRPATGPLAVARKMAARDPAYRPGDTTSPFATLQRYRQSRRAPPPVCADIYSSCLELAWPGGAAAAPEPVLAPRVGCHSLPASPVCGRRADCDRPPPALTLTEAPALRRLASCESGFYSSVGEGERASVSDLSPASLRSACSHDDASLATLASSVYTGSSDDVSSLGCDSEGRPERSSERSATDFRRILAYFERSGASGRTLRLSLGCRQRTADRLSLERARLRLQRAERALVPDRLVADCRRLFDSSAEDPAPAAGQRARPLPRVPVSEGIVRDKRTVFEKSTGAPRAPV